jgi:RNA-directed DNA polymerase
MMETESEKRLLAYQRKRLKRAKNRKVRVEAVADDWNMRLAVQNSRKGKRSKKGVIIFDKDYDGNLARLKAELLGGTFKTSEGHDCMRRCPCGKVRKLHKLPYFPDHIMHHALMQVLMPYLVKALYVESGASVKGRGMMYAKRRTERWIDEHKGKGRLYYVKLDFVKFYENVDQQALYDCLCRKFSNPGVRHLLKEIIFAMPKGLGIGLYPIQSLTNHYMSYLCREVSGIFDVKVEIYCDDVVVMGEDKSEVWRAVNYIKAYAENVLRQPLHSNIGMQIIDQEHFLDFVGFRFYFDHTLLRKRMKIKFKRKMHSLKDPMRKYRVAMSYKGWLMHCGGFNLWRATTGMNTFDDFDMPEMDDRDADGKRMFDGQRMSASYFLGRNITFMDAEFDVASKVHRSGKTNVVLVEENKQRFKFFTNNKKLVEQLKWCADNDKFPFLGKLKRMNQSGNPDIRIVGTRED